MKYEARNVGGIATSTASITPWVSITQTAAISACSALGSGYHLITNSEWTTLARHLSAQASNWSTGTVGSGVLPRGYSANSMLTSGEFTNNVVAPSTGEGYEYNTADNTVGSSGIFTFKRTHILANGQIIWDLSGNVWEWNSDTCTTNWYNSKNWIEWNDSNLSDYELGTAGPDPLYTHTQNAGYYYGCTSIGYGMVRGGSWSYSLYSGIFTLDMRSSQSAEIGFRCAK